jgi:hypothetical protein
VLILGLKRLRTLSVDDEWNGRFDVAHHNRLKFDIRSYCYNSSTSMNSTSPPGSRISGLHIRLLTMVNFYKATRSFAWLENGTHVHTMCIDILWSVLCFPLTAVHRLRLGSPCTLLALLRLLGWMDNPIYLKNKRRMDNDLMTFRGQTWVRNLYLTHEIRLAEITISVDPPGAYGRIDVRITTDWNLTCIHSSYCHTATVVLWHQYITSFSHF